MMLNGDVLEGKITENNDDFGFISYNFTTKSGKTKSGTVEHYRVFSIIDADGQETMYYEQDSMAGYVFTENEMRAYIIGERDAKLSYKPTLTLLGGIGLGVGTVLFDTYRTKADTEDGQTHGFFQAEPSIMPIVVPLVFTIAAGIPRVKVRLGGVSHTQYITDEYYLLGYEKKGRSKRVFRAFGGSISGVAAGFISYYLFR